MAIAVDRVVRRWHLPIARHYLLQMCFLQCNKSQRTPCMLLTPTSIVESQFRSWNLRVLLLKDRGGGGGAHCWVTVKRQGHDEGTARHRLNARVHPHGTVAVGDFRANNTLQANAKVRNIADRLWARCDTADSVLRCRAAVVAHHLTNILLHSLRVNTRPIVSYSDLNESLRISIKFAFDLPAQRTSELVVLIPSQQTRVNSGATVDYIVGHADAVMADGWFAVMDGICDEIAKQHLQSNWRTC